jgi:outer membrane lipoprotein-sorting protein
LQKKLIIIIFLFIIVTSGCLSATTNLVDAKKIIIHAQEKYESTNVLRATMVSITNYQGEEVTRQIDFLFKKPNKYKCVNQAENLTLISNGTVAWMYNSTNSGVTIKHLENSKEIPDFDYGMFLKNLLVDNDVKLIEEKELFGKHCYVIEAIPKNVTSIISQDVWIDKESSIPIKIDKNYRIYNSSIEYINVSVNENVSDNEFEFDIPTGVKNVDPEVLTQLISVEEAQKSLNFTIMKPSYSAGYQLKGATIIKYPISANGEKRECVTSIYNKEGNILTIDETLSNKIIPTDNNINIGEFKGRIVDIFGNKMINYYHGNIYISITGTLNEKELIKIAESVK